MAGIFFFKCVYIVPSLCCWEGWRLCITLLSNAIAVYNISVCLLSAL